MITYNKRDIKCIDFISTFHASSKPRTVPSSDKAQKWIVEMSLWNCDNVRCSSTSNTYIVHNTYMYTLSTHFGIGIITLQSKNWKNQYLCIHITGKMKFIFFSLDFRLQCIFTKGRFDCVRVGESVLIG